MSFCSTIYGNLPESGFVYTATSVSVDNGSFQNLSATNATIVNLETTTFNPTNVDCTTLTADDATITNISGTNATIDNLEVANFDITTLQATTANISTINTSIINSSHSNLSTIGTFRINISEASDPALASVIRRDANNLLFEGRNDPTDTSAKFIFFTTEEGAGYGPTLQMNLSNVDIRNLSGDKLTYTNASIDNLSATDIVASGAIDAFSVEANLLTATSNLATPFVNTSDLQTQLINSSQVNASNISTRNLSAVLQITSTFIDATNRMTAPTLNTLVNNVSIVNASTINSQIGNFSTTNIINNNVSSVFVKRSTGGKATIDMTTTQVLDIDGGFLDAANVTARGVTIRAGNDISPAISVGNDNGVVITNLSSVNFETDNLTTDTANVTTGNISTLNVSTLNALVKNASTMNASTMNVCTLNSSFCNALVVDSSIVKSTIYELEDGSGGGGSNGVISESANELQIRTGASGGTIKFGTTTGGNFSVQIANDALNASTINCSQLNATDIDATTIDADTITGDIGGNLTAGSGISLSTAAGVTTISNTGSVTDPLNISVINLSTLNGLTANISTINSSTGNIALVNASVVNSDFINGNIANNLAAGTNITLSTTGGVTTINSIGGGGVTDPLNVSVVNLSTLNGLTSNISTNNASIFVTNNGYNMVGSNATNTAGGIGSAFGNSAAFGHVSQVLGNNTYAISQTSGGKTFVNCAPTEELGLYHGGVEKITITSTEVDIRQDCNMSTSNTSTSNALVSNISQVNASNMSLINLSADLITGDISPNLTAGTGITLSTTSGVTTINSTGLSTSTQYYFRATSDRTTPTQAITSGTILDYNDIVYDVPSGNYDEGNQKYVVPIAGTFQFFFQAFQLSSSGVSDFLRIGIYQNNNLMGMGGGYAANCERVGVILECAVGDEIQVKGVSGTENVYMAVTYSWFEGYLLQPENNTITSSTDLITNSLTTTTTNVSNSNISNLTIDNNLNGQSFIRTVAIAKILGNGGNSKAVGCSVTRTAVGRYTCTISPARPDAQYVIQLTCMETSGALDDVIIQVQDGTMTTTGFNYFIHEQDNGGSPGAYRDRNNFITVFDTD